jgi:ribosomal protein S18 acetylase RimI-like enzyme
MPRSASGRTGRIAKNEYRVGRAAQKDLEPCLDILMDSILGEEYFSRELAEGILYEGISRKEVYIAKTAKGEIAGFFRLVLDGVFLVFAYIHLLAVKTDYRGRGVGTLLLEEAERLIREEREYPDIKKSFLLVGKINRRAKSFYERRGYRRVSTLDDLFSEGDTEFLMMKDLRDSR